MKEWIEEVNRIQELHDMDVCFFPNQLEDLENLKALTPMQTEALTAFHSGKSPLEFLLDYHL